MKYISLFSGVGGLESPTSPPVLCCESDPKCLSILHRRLGGFEVHPDVRRLQPPQAEVVCGGWPCQDLSVAGLQVGLSGSRSGLFYELLRVAKESGAHTIVAENVPNLLRLEKTATFRRVLEAFVSAGYPAVAWRSFNAREFGLPHQRERVFIIASRHREIALSLHRRHAPDAADVESQRRAAGFYWTAGLHALCYSAGYSPTLKVGSSLSIPSPPAVHFDGCVRKLTARECTLLQGFNPEHFAGVRDQDVYRMMGNAVAAPVGRFVMMSAELAAEPGELETAHFVTGPSGLYMDGELAAVTHPSVPLARNLDRLVDYNNREQLSGRAAAGLLLRLRKSGKPCPTDLMELIVSLAKDTLESASPKDLDEVAGLDDERDGLSGAGEESSGELWPEFDFPE